MRTGCVHACVFAFIKAAVKTTVHQESLCSDMFVFSSEIDDDGVIEPDTDEPQEMGEFENIEVKCQAFFFFFFSPIQTPFSYSATKEGLEIRKAFGTSERIYLTCADPFPQVTEEMMDQANEKKMDAINAQGEGRSIFCPEPKKCEHTVSVVTR